MKRLFAVRSHADGVRYFESKTEAKKYRDGHKQKNLYVERGPDHWKGESKR